MQQLPNIRELLERGHAALASSKAAKDVEVAGHPRVGSVGCVSATDEVYGVCHRKAHLRLLGVEENVDLGTRIMWGNGEVNEVYWDRILDAADRPFCQGVDIKLEIDGVPKAVLGHPDGVFYDNGTPIMGVELKGIYSFKTANTVLGGRPKNENLIQAATYAHALSVPFVLVYTSASYVTIPAWAKKDYPKQSSLHPFVKVFYLEWRGNDLVYRDEDSQDWVTTTVTWSGIEEYYRLVAHDITAAKNLGPRVTASYVNGDANKWGAQSDCKFCPFSGACDQYDKDKDYDEWLATAKEVAHVSLG